MNYPELPSWERMTVGDALQIGPAIGMRHRVLLDWVVPSDTDVSLDYHRLGLERDNMLYTVEFYGETMQQPRERGYYRRPSGFGEHIVWAAFTAEDGEYGERLKLFPDGPRASKDLMYSDYVAQVAPWSKDVLMPFVDFVERGREGTGMKLRKLRYKKDAEDIGDMEHTAHQLEQE